MTNRLLGVAALLVLVAGAADAKRKPERRADAEPARCDRFSQETDKAEKSIDFNLKNLCSVEIKCSLSWNVRCADGATGGGPQSVQLVVAPGTSETTRASAQVCGDAAWSISAAEWTCRRTSSDTATR
jgi:hypothetical protein